MILAVTCAIRDNAERKIWSRLDYFRSLKRKRLRTMPPLRVGLLGVCVCVCVLDIARQPTCMELLGNCISLYNHAMSFAYKDIQQICSIAQTGPCMCMYIIMTLV